MARVCTILYAISARSAPFSPCTEAGLLRIYLHRSGGGPTGQTMVSAPNRSLGHRGRPHRNACLDVPSNLNRPISDATIPRQRNVTRYTAEAMTLTLPICASWGGHMNAKQLVLAVMRARRTSNPVTVMSDSAGPSVE